MARRAGSAQVARCGGSRWLRVLAARWAPAKLHSMLCTWQLWKGTQWPNARKLPGAGTIQRRPEGFSGRASTDTGSGVSAADCWVSSTCPRTKNLINSAVRSFAHAAQRIFAVVQPLASLQRRQGTAGSDKARIPNVFPACTRHSLLERYRWRQHPREARKLQSCTSPMRVCGCSVRKGGHSNSACSRTTFRISALRPAQWVALPLRKLSWQWLRR